MEPCSIVEVANISEQHNGSNIKVKVKEAET
jgi:hypothetical protein